MLRTVKFLGGIARQLSTPPVRKILFHSTASSFAPIVIDEHSASFNKKDLESEFSKWSKYWKTIQDTIKVVFQEESKEKNAVDETNFQILKSTVEYLDNIEDLKILVSQDTVNWDLVFEKLEKLDVELIPEEVKHNMLFKATILSYEPNVLDMIVNKYHIPIDSTNDKQCTVLYQACLQSHPEVVKLLLDLGARPDIKIFADKTPYYAAAIRSNEEEKEKDGIKIFKMLCAKLPPTQELVDDIAGIFAGANLSVEDAAKDIIGNEKWNLTIMRQLEKEKKMGYYFNLDDYHIEVVSNSKSDLEPETESCVIGEGNDNSKLDN